jgi:hypothetical protein
MSARSELDAVLDGMYKNMDSLTMKYYSDELHVDEYPDIEPQILALWDFLEDLRNITLDGEDD